jgi:hypothetical protein
MPDEAFCRTLRQTALTYDWQTTREMPRQILLIIFSVLAIYQHMTEKG